MNTRDIRVACISALIVTDDASYSVGTFKIRKKKKMSKFFISIYQFCYK